MFLETSGPGAQSTQVCVRLQRAPALLGSRDSGAHCSRHFALRGSGGQVGGLRAGRRSCQMLPPPPSWGGSVRVSCLVAVPQCGSQPCVSGRRSSAPPLGEGARQHWADSLSGQQLGVCSPMSPPTIPTAKLGVGTSAGQMSSGSCLCGALGVLA